MAQVRVLQRDVVGKLGLALSHPLYYLIAIGAQHLPVQESAYKTNLVSALFGAVTVANLWLLVYLLTACPWSAVIGAISLSVAHTFWQHCALAEVYTITTAVLTAEFLCFVQYLHTRRVRWLILLFGVNGLGVSNHMLASLSLACYGVWLVLHLVRGDVPVMIIPCIFAAWAAGASPYLWLIIRDVQAGASWLETFRSALCGAYARNVLNVFPSSGQFKNSLLYLGMNYPTPAFLLVLSAVACRGASRTAIGMLAALLSIYLIWAVRYNVPDQYTFFIPAIVLTSAAIGLGARAWLANRRRTWRPALILLAALPAVVYVPLPTIARSLRLNMGLTRSIPYRDEYDYFLHPWKTGYRGAEQFAAEVARLLPADAVLLADSTTVRPIHYFQLTGRWQSRAKVYPSLEAPQVTGAMLQDTIVPDAVSRGTAYVVTPQPPYAPQWLVASYSFEPVGPFYRIKSRAATSRPG